MPSLPPPESFRELV